MVTEKMNIKVTFQNAARRGMSGLTGDLKKVGTQTRKTAKGLNSMYTQLAGIATLLAGGALFGSSIKTFAAFDDNMRAAGAVTSATADEMERMTDIAKELGRETRFTASQSAGALRFLGMAGFEAAEAIEALPGVLNLAAAGALDLGTAADITTNVLTAFGIEVENLGRVNDVLVKTFTSSNVNLIEMGEAFKMVGPIAKGVGGDFEDLVGTIGALGNAGIKGTLAGTALKNAIDALLAPSKKEAALMKKLEERMGGVALQVRDASGDFIGFRKVMEQLEKAGLRGDEALQAFGLRAGPAMVALLNQGSESLAELIQKLKEAGGTAEEIARQMEEGIGGQLRKTISVLESFQIALGAAFGPEVLVVLTAFRDKINDVTLELTKLKEKGTLDGVGQAIVDTFTTVNWVLDKSIDLLQSWTSLTIAAGAVLTGNFNLAKVAMQDYLKEANQLAGVEPKFDGVVTKPITAEMNAARKVMEDAAKESGPIGKGTKKVGDVLAKNIIPLVSIEAKLKAALIKVGALLATEKAQLESDYDQKLVSLDEYHDKRISIVAQKIEQERKILEEKLSGEADISKKEILNAKLIALDQALLAETININAQRKQDQEKLDKDLLRKTEDLNRKKYAADTALRDQQNRLKEERATTLDIEIQNEIAALQDKQNKELEIVKAYHAAILQNLKDSKAGELEIEKAHQDQKKALEEQDALQKKEKEQQAADQSKKISKFQLDSLAKNAGHTATIFGNLYKLLGEERKELLLIAQGAAFTEASFNIATAITEALPNYLLAGSIATTGAVQLASIASQALADGGEVMGSSPSPTADNIGIMATAGEFMQPVSSVDYYGKGVMEAMRSKSIPKGAFSGYATGGFISQGRKSRFADGGLVSDSVLSNKSIQIDMNNTFTGVDQNTANQLSQDFENIVIKTLQKVMN